MSESVGVIYYEVEADTSQLLDSTNALDSALAETQKSMEKTDESVKKLSKSANNTSSSFSSLADKTHKAKASIDNTNQAIIRVDQSANTLSSSFGNLGMIMGGVFSLHGIGVLVQMTEGYNEMAERVQMVTADHEEYLMVQERLLETANRTYRSLKESQEVYILTSDSLRSIGYTTQEALDITDSLSYAFVKNATSADRGKNAIQAYTNAIMKGKVEADGWATIVAAVPSVINDIAKAANLSAEEVRKLGAEGKLSAEMLNEGLRQSLDSNKKAADGMATTVKDAFTAMTNNLSVYLGEVNSASGATQLMSSAMLAFGNNIEGVANALFILGSGALAKYIYNIGAATASTVTQTIATRSQAAEELRLATAHAASTAATLAHQQANVGLTMSTTASSAAAAAHTAATVRLAAAQAAARAASVGLLGVLGGPAGLVALAVSAGVAFLTMGSNAEESKPKIDLLTESIVELGDAQLRVMKTNLLEKVGEMESLEGAAKTAEMRIEYLNRQLAQTPGSKQAAAWRKEIDEQAAAIETANQELSRYRNQLSKVEEEQAKRTGDRTGVKSRIQKGDPEAEKRLVNLREELELTKLTGEARAKLKAIQDLGGKATPEQREEAEKLASEIYNLTEQRKKLKDATAEGIKEEKKAAQHHKENQKVITELAKAVEQASLKGDELARAKAKAKLNEFATEDQIRKVEELSTALRKVNAEAENRKVLDDMAMSVMLLGLKGEELAAVKARAQLNEFATADEIAALDEMARLVARVADEESRRQAFGKKPEEYLMGDVKPLSGGGFDSQAARYEEERKNEIKRYEEQLLRMKEARELQIETRRSYDEIEAEMAQTHADRMQQIEEAKNSAILKSGQDVFGQMADAIKGYVGESSAAYRALFAISKAFAIADAGVKFNSALMTALNSGPFPANLAAMSTVAAAGGSLLSAISGAFFGGGKQYGGPVAANKMYRINETGAPEVFNAANGRQYMLPNTRGEVVSNKDATRQPSSGSRSVTVNQTIIVQGQIDSYTASQLERKAATRQEAVVGRLGRGTL